MSSVIALLLLVILAAIGYFAYREYRKGRENRLPAYTEALMDLLDDNKDAAFAKLKETVNQDTNNVDAYLRLAQLFKERGQADRANRIYQILSVRRGLATADEQKILMALAREHLSARRTNKAISVLEQMSNLDPRDTASREMLLFVYAETERWDEVKELLKALVKVQKDKHRAALYLTEVGARIFAKEPDTAAGYFAQALQLDGKLTPALVYTGDALFVQGKVNEAVDRWKQVLIEKPDLGFMVLDRIEKAFFETGRYEDMLKVYEELIARMPSDPSLYVPLARIYSKKGDVARAQSVLSRAPVKGKENPVVALMLAELNLDRNEVGEARKELAQVDKLLSSRLTRCRHCGFLSEGDFAWHCPQCGSWESFELEKAAQK